MKSNKMSLKDAIELMISNSNIAVTNDVMFRERHGYLTMESMIRTLDLNYFLESETENVHCPKLGYSFVDSTKTYLKSAFCPTVSDILTDHWYAFTYVRN